MTDAHPLDLLKNDLFLSDKFNNNNNNDYYQYNLKDFPTTNDIDFTPTNHIISNHNLILKDEKNKKNNIDIKKIDSYLKKNNINLPLDVISDCFNTYILHNNIKTMNEQQLLTDFLKKINFYNQFYKRATPIYNNKKQTHMPLIVEKHIEADNNLRQANGVAKAMEYHNSKYKKNKF